MLDHVQCFYTTTGGHDVVGCFTQENLNEKLHDDRLILNVKNVLNRCSYGSRRLPLVFE